MSRLNGVSFERTASGEVAVQPHEPPPTLLQRGGSYLLTLGILVAAFAVFAVGMEAAMQRLSPHRHVCMKASP